MKTSSHSRRSTLAAVVMSGVTISLAGACSKSEPQAPQHAVQVSPVATSPAVSEGAPMGAAAPSPGPTSSVAPAAPAKPSDSAYDGLSDKRQGRAKAAAEPAAGAPSPSAQILATAPERFDDVRVVGGKPPADMYFKDFGTNPTIETSAESTSTFAVDVDTASYSVARSFLQRGIMPDEAAVRVEEFVNSFNYAYESPRDEAFLVQAESFPSPNRRGYHVLHLGIKGREVPASERKAANLVFVIDVSGSMDMENRLGLVKRSLGLLIDQLDSRDSVGVVVYGSDARIVLEPTRVTASGRSVIRDAVDRLVTEGSTNAGAGLTLGYDMASRYLRPGNVNRVILCSDGVANTGTTDPDAIMRRVAREAVHGVTITTIGVGMGNYNDVLLERLADTGNGNYAYVDTLDQARRVFVDQLTGTLQVIAKDVKLQMEFDERVVARYRLIGFENRVLDNRDFANDRVDAGEIGAGHTVTAMYEVKFKDDAVRAGTFGTLRVRYKAPEGERSELIERRLPMGIVRASYSQAAAPTQLSFVAASFGEKLRGSYWVRNLSYDDILRLWSQIPEGLRDRADVIELRSLIVTARSLDTRGDKYERILPVAMMDFDHVPVLR